MSRRPPLRYYIGCVGMAAVMIFVEKAAHLSAGGVGGLAIALNGLLGWSVGLANLGIKLVLFAIVYLISGKRVAFWTLVSSFIIGLSAWLFESVPLPFVWPQWLAFLVLITVSYFPAGLVLSAGYSSGGLTSIAQALKQSRHIPIWLSMLGLNGVVVVAMYVAYGQMSGIFTLLATFWQGGSIQLWTKWVTRWWGTGQVPNPRPS